MGTTTEEEGKGETRIKIVYQKQQSTWLGTAQKGGQHGNDDHDMKVNIRNGNNRNGNDGKGAKHNNQSAENGRKGGRHQQQGPTMT
jgi:hypothetical protein